MKIEITEAKLTGDEVEVTAKLMGTLADIESKAKRDDYYKYSVIVKEVIGILAQAVAEAYLAQNKMELINSLSKEDVVNAIQLKIIEKFSIQGQR